MICIVNLIKKIIIISGTMLSGNSPSGRAQFGKKVIRQMAFGRMVGNVKLQLYCIKIFFRPLQKIDNFWVKIRDFNFRLELIFA